MHDYPSSSSLVCKMASDASASRLAQIFNSDDSDSHFDGFSGVENRLVHSQLNSSLLCKCSRAIRANPAILRYALSGGSCCRAVSCARREPLSAVCDRARNYRSRPE